MPGYNSDVASEPRFEYQVDPFYVNPNILYSDNDTAIDAPIVQKWFEDQGIKHITTRTRAAQAERQIRTFKDLLEKRMENNPAEKPFHLSNIANL